MPVRADPARGAVAGPSRLLLESVGQGLVRFDAAGQIEAGLAERWTVIDGGRTYLFRLRAARWADGEPVRAEQVVASLKRLLRPGSRDPLAPFLTAVADVAAMTPQVIEVRLARPRPDLLRLFAQPELAVLRPDDGAGTGPMRCVQSDCRMLRPNGDPSADGDDPTLAERHGEVRLTGRRAALAIARFANGRADLVAGGGFADWPLVTARGDVAATAQRIDPAAGLFGLAVVARTGFLAEPLGRAAVAAAIDRARLVAAVMPGWSPSETILPAALDSAQPPVSPAWAALSFDDRVSLARGVVLAWRGGPVAIRIAMPAGPGATLVFGALAADLARTGIAVQRVAPGQPSDLALIDLVAPYDSARWYLASACRACGPAASAALLAARDAATLADRSARIAEADRAVADDGGYIPIARPLRWSLVSPRLVQWQANARAAHPLNRLTGDTN